MPPLQPPSPVKLLIGGATCLLLLNVAFNLKSLRAAGAPCKLGETCLNTAKELELGVKLMLNKLKIRNEPLARTNNEKLLKKSLAKQRKLSREIAQLEGSIAALTRRTRKRADSDSDGDEEESDQAGQRVKFTHLTKRELQTLREQLEVKRRQLSQLNVTIEEARNIIDHPESYVRVPSNYGARSPEMVQDEEREVLTQDLKDMDRRDKIRRGLIPEPLILSDKW